MKKIEIFLQGISLTIDAQEDIVMCNSEIAEQYETPITGIINYTNDEDEIIEIGTFHSSLINLGEMLNDEVNWFEYLDELSWDNLYDIVTSENLEEEEMVCLSNGLYVISDITVKEEYKDMFVELLVAQTLIKRFASGYDYVLLLNKKFNKNKLNYYARAGFSKLKNTEFLFFNNLLMKPTMKEIIYDDVWKKELESRLKNAVEIENYEAASSIRDIIKKGRVIYTIQI